MTTADNIKTEFCDALRELRDYARGEVCNADAAAILLPEAGDGAAAWKLLLLSLQTAELAARQLHRLKIKQEGR